MDIPFLERLAQGFLLFDGGIGTEIYARGVFLNKCYEELNLVRPAVVEEIHRSFYQAGAEAVETNTFAANGPRLEPHGLRDRVHEINAAAAQLARSAVGGGAYVAGAIGPLGIRLEPWGPTTFGEAIDLFKVQISGLIDGGVDLLVLETFTDLMEIQAAVQAARELGKLPVVAMMTVDEGGQTPEGVPTEWMVQKLETTGADVIGVNCSVGPAPMLTVLETMAGITRLPLAAMPNAGMPRNVEGRMIYLTSPIYMGRYARRFRKLGARVIGGCCGVTPEHIRAMRDALSEGGEKCVIPRITVPPPRVSAIDLVPGPERSALARKVDEGRFVTLVELPPTHGWDTEDLLDRLQAWVEAGVDGAFVPDDTRVSARLSSLALARLVLERMGIPGAEGGCEPVLEYSCRHRDLLGMQSDLLGAHALGVRNLFLVTGQVPRPGETSWSSGVFDIDAIGLTNVAHRLNHGLDVGDVPIGKPTAFFTGALATVGAPCLEEEVSRFEWKVDAGAEYAITSPIFDVGELTAFLEHVAAVRVPVIARLWVLESLLEAEYLAEELPGVNLPSRVLERMARAAEIRGEAETGLEIAVETFQAISPYVEGVLICGSGALQSASISIVKETLGTKVACRRSFPGHPGIKGGAEGSRYR